MDLNGSLCEYSYVNRPRARILDHRGGILAWFQKDTGSFPALITNVKPSIITFWQYSGNHWLKDGSGTKLRCKVYMLLYPHQWTNLNVIYRSYALVINSVENRPRENHYQFQALLKYLTA
jgi:hypothetical protein